MKRMSKTIVKGFALMIAAATLSACSNVSFTPVDDGASKEEVLPPGTSTSETFLFNDNDTTAKVDILFVVDNSDSMVQEQAKLSTRLSSFINSLAKIDWQIGVTTTDITDGPYGLKGSLLPMNSSGLQVLNKNVSGYATLFKNVVTRPETASCAANQVDCASSDERPLGAITLAMMKKNTDNKLLFRDGADLVVVILTDENEGSTGNGTGLATPASVVATAKAMFGLKKNFSVFGIITEPGDTECYDEQSQYAGQYSTIPAALASLTGGETGSICDSDYSSTLDSIGKRVRNAVKTITLKGNFDPASVNLVITPADGTLTWEIEGNQIIFNKPPKQNTRVDVYYTTI